MRTQLFFKGYFLNANLIYEVEKQTSLTKKTHHFKLHIVANFVRYFNKLITAKNHSSYLHGTVIALKFSAEK